MQSPHPDPSPHRQLSPDSGSSAPPSERPGQRSGQQPSRRSGPKRSSGPSPREVALHRLARETKGQNEAIAAAGEAVRELSRTEETRPLTREEQERARALRLEIGAHRLALAALRAEFEVVRGAEKP